MARKLTQAERREREEKIAKALEMIADGQSVREACEAVDIPLKTFRDNVDGTQYARAREAQADSQFDEMDDLEADCLEGRIDPQVFRVAMDARKWRLARMRPKVYGDRIEVNSTSNVRWSTEDCESAAVAAKDELERIRAARNETYGIPPEELHVGPNAT